MFTVLEYVERTGRRPFQVWFDGLNAEAAAKVTVALTRLHQEKIANTKGVGHGIHEYRIDFGPGYRIYFGRDGEQIVILLGGGTKKRQDQDIATASARWQDYKLRKQKAQR